MHTLEDIRQLEDDRQFTEALDAYDRLYQHDSSEYNVWKHYFFLLWEVVEEVDENTLLDKKVRPRMKELLAEGKTRFSDLADFNFIAGYAIAMFPYEFGDYDDMLQSALGMLRKAHVLEPGNTLYRYLATSFAGEEEEELSRHKHAALPVIRATFQGKGALNKYFRQVLLHENADIISGMHLLFIQL